MKQHIHPSRHGLSKGLFTLQIAVDLNPVCRYIKLRLWLLASPSHTEFLAAKRFKEVQK